MADEYLYRTAITRLELSSSGERALRELLDAWRTGCSIATDYAWPTTDSARDIQSSAYDAIRNETGLKSQHAILACESVADAMSSIKERRNSGQTVSKPTFRAPTVTYDSRTMTLFEDGSVSLTTLDTRVSCDLVLPDDENGYQYQYLDSPSWHLTESTLTARDGGFYLHLGFRKPKPVSEPPEHRTVLGVDLGIEHLAVTSTGRFFPGGEFTHTQQEAIKREHELQLTGTRSAYQTLEQVHTRRRRRGRDKLHRIANGIIAEAVEHDCSTIAFEDLTDIRERLPTATAVHRWAFRVLFNFVEYRAEERDIEVVRVDPTHTSQRCSRIDCGHTASGNRPTRDQFCCQECGYEVAADYNAAKNVGLRCVRRDHTSSRRTGVGQCALASGTLSPDEGFTDKSGNSDA